MMNNNIVKVDWWGEELDTYHKKMGSPKKIWKDNEGLPYGIYYYFDKEEDPFDRECFWFKTIEERDKAFDDMCQDEYESAMESQAYANTVWGDAEDDNRGGF
jgi:hypothetical protein